ncbi:enoyl-CoA hydratase/isomerase family protein [Chloroflexota bacterium]
MAYKKITLEKRGAIGKITLNRPEVLNAMDVELLTELAAALNELDKDDSVNVAILMGAGRAFSAGRDIKAIRDGRGHPGLKWYKALEDFSKPVIAAVHGYCFTGAVEMLTYADIVIASEDAVFSDTHARFGLIPGGGQTQRLPRQIGPRKAKELMFTSDRISAIEAERIGFINKVVPTGKLEEAATEMAEKILQNVPESIKALKYLVNEGLKTDLESGVRMEAEIRERAKSVEEERNKRINGIFKKK